MQDISFPNDFHRKVAIPPSRIPDRTLGPTTVNGQNAQRGGSTGGWRGGSTGGQGENAVTDSICRSIFLCPMGSSNSGLNVETWIAGPKRWLFIPGNSSAWAVKILVRKIWAQWLRVVRSQIDKKKMQHHKIRKCFAKK